MVFHSDGRVSESTVSLIRNLLVLQPSKRLTAEEVLDSVTTIIATFKVPATLDNLEEQVVPDIDNVKEDENNKKSQKQDALKSTQEKILDDFSKQITAKVCNYIYFFSCFFELEIIYYFPLQEKKHQLIKLSPLISRPRQFNQITVYRVDSDARELNPAELDRFSHLIPRDSQRLHHHNINSRSDVLLASVSRARGSLRNRNVNGNQIPSRDYSMNIRQQALIGAPLSNSTNNVNSLNERLFHSQPQNQPSNSIVMMDRIVANGSRPDGDPYLLDADAGRPSRNLFNNVSVLANYNRTSNPGSVTNQNPPPIAGNGHWMNAGI